VKNILRQFPWHVLLFSAYPVMALFAYNLGEAGAEAFLRPLIVSLAAGSILFALIAPIARNIQRAGLIVSLTTVLFFTYGHVVSALADQKVSIPVTALMLFYGLLALTGNGWLAFRLKNPERATVPLNVIALALLAFPIVSMIGFDAQRVLARADVDPAVALNLPADAPRPDIYYIILDSYGRSDLLLDTYDYDNSAFLRRLEDLGFTVATCSQSNYHRTEVSLGSSLNMDYLQNVDPSFNGRDNQNRALLWEKLKHSAVRRALESAGYTTVAFATGFDWLEIKDADVYIEPGALDSQLTAFEALFLRTTFLRGIEDAGLIDLSQDEAQQYRERTLIALNSADQLLKIPGPKFVYMHIVSPHPPFVFGPNGEELDAQSYLNADQKYTPSAYMSGYVLQSEFLTPRVVDLVTRLIRESPTPPIIVIQGDHAPWMQAKSRAFEILNAYYLPDHADAVYPGISPVNTFRVILSTYLGADYPLLEDVSYYSPVPYLFDFSLVTTHCPKP
jgi:hypothetical protein